MLHMGTFSNIHAVYIGGITNASRCVHSSMFPKVCKMITWAVRVAETSRICLKRGNSNPSSTSCAHGIHLILRTYYWHRMKSSMNNIYKPTVVNKAAKRKNSSISADTNRWNVKHTVWSTGGNTNLKGGKVREAFCRCEEDVITDVPALCQHSRKAYRRKHIPAAQSTAYLIFKMMEAPHNSRQYLLHAIRP